MEKSMLVGYLRKSKNGMSITISIDMKALKEIGNFYSNNGKDFITLISNTNKVEEVINGDRQVVSVCYLKKED